MAEWACTVSHNTRTRRQQWNCVAAASHHARKLCSGLSENILETRNRKRSKSSEKNWRRKGSFKTLKCTDMYAASISGNPSEAAEVRRAHWGKQDFQNRPYTLSPVICHKFLWRKGTDTGSDLGRPFLYSCPCLGLSHNFCSTCCTLAWKRPSCTGVMLPVNPYDQQPWKTVPSLSTSAPFCTALGEVRLTHRHASCSTIFPTCPEHKAGGQK